MTSIKDWKLKLKLSIIFNIHYLISYTNVLWAFDESCSLKTPWMFTHFNINSPYNFGKNNAMTKVTGEVIFGLPRSMSLLPQLFGSTFSWFMLSFITSILSQDDYQEPSSNMHGTSKLISYLFKPRMPFCTISVKFKISTFHSYV